MLEIVSLDGPRPLDEIVSSEHGATPLHRTHE